MKCIKFGQFTYPYCYHSTVVSTRWANKGKPQIFAHIFAKYWPIFKIFHRHILWKI